MKGAGGQEGASDTLGRLRSRGRVGGIDKR